MNQEMGPKIETINIYLMVKRLVKEVFIMTTIKNSEESSFSYISFQIIEQKQVEVVPLVFV